MLVHEVTRAIKQADKGQMNSQVTKTSF